MKAIEFESTMAPSGQIALPTEVASEIPVGEQLKILVMWEPESEWQTAGRRAFEAAYCPEDVIYEQLIDDLSPR